MNNLEFIEKEIEQNKRLFERYTNHLLAFPSSIIENKREEIREELTHLKQIKFELEAWEVVKEQLCLRIADHEDKIFGTKYGLQVEYDNIIPLTDEEVKSFKKALEVEDEKENKESI